MLTSVLANFLPLTIAFNFYLLIQSNANNAASDAGGGVGLTPTTVGIPVLGYAASDAGGGVGLTPTTVGIPVLGYLIGAAIFFAGAYFIYRRLVLKKKDVLSK
jgi:hypothetical protein